MKPNADWTEPLDAIYSAVGEPNAWNAALDSLCEILHADSALLFTPCPQLLDLPHHYSKRYSLDTAKDYIQNFVSHDVYNAAAVDKNMFRTGVIATGEELIPMQALKSTRFFNEFLVKHNQGHLLTSLPFAPDNTHMLAPVVLSFYKPAHAQPFADEDINTLTKLLPHVQRAWLLHDQAMKYKSLNNSLEGVLNQLSHGVVVLDAAHKMQFANATAKRFLSALYLYDMKLQNTEAISLPKQILQAATHSSSGKLICKKIILGDSEQWFMVVAPIKKLPHWALSQNCDSTVIWLTKNEPGHTNNVCLMTELFKLTHSEAKVLGLLLENKTAKIIADELKIKVSTVRSHLTSLLTKTVSRRQQDLIRLATVFTIIETEN
ncbi:MAG: LuxR C-terminal-related transcriptional regulator [Methylophilaceae bacterium]